MIHRGPHAKMDQLYDTVRRRIANVTPSDLMTPSRIVERAADAVSDDAEPTSTIAPYYQDLNGVNQPMNMVFKEGIWWMLGIAALLVLGIRISQLLWMQLRQVAAMTQPREKQAYWKYSQHEWMPWIKKYVLYAPLGKKRHNREIRLSIAGHMGTLPSRFHTIVVGVFLLSNTIYMFWVDWNQENKYALCAEIRGRSGTLSMVNMVPLIILAGRNNPLIWMLHISFDTYNLLHRWMGRVVIIEAVIHAISWSIPAVADLEWSGATEASVTSWFYGSGWIATFAMVILLIGSLSPVRHAFYETFLNSHIALAIITFGGTLIHCATAHIEGGLPQLPWIIAIFTLWGLDRFARFARLAYCNWTRAGFTTAGCQAMPHDVTRVTLTLPRHVDIKPGTHAYLRFWGVNRWECHPFSIAWVDHHATRASGLPVSEKEPLTGIDCSRTTTSVSFLIAAQTGFTRKLYDTAVAHSKRFGSPAVFMKAAMEGPYAGHHSLDSYGHAVLFAGSTGITHQLSYIRHLLKGYNDGTIATRRVTLVWVIREYDSLEWVREWMTEILRIPHRRDILRINVFITRPNNARDMSPPSETVKLFPGRPNIPLLLAKEMAEQVGAMCVTVCGPGALADDVRSAAIAVQGETVCDFFEESFTW